MDLSVSSILWILRPKVRITYSMIFPLFNWYYYLSLICEINENKRKKSLWLAQFLTYHLLKSSLRDKQVFTILQIGPSHRHWREEIYCSLAEVGGPAAGTECRGKSIHLPCIRAKKCFKAAAATGDITTTVHRCRQAGPTSSLLLIDVYGPSPSFF